MECSANRRGEACLARQRSGNRTAISVQRTVPCVMLLDVSLRGAKRRGNLAVHNWITGRPRRKRKRLLEIATAPSGPHNDKLGSLMPMNLRCMICKCTRRSLSAATDAIGVYHFNGSQYESGVHCRERHAAPLQGVCGRQSAAAFPSAIRYDVQEGRPGGRPLLCSLPVFCRVFRRIAVIEGEMHMRRGRLSPSGPSGRPCRGAARRWTVSPTATSGSSERLA